MSLNVANVQMRMDEYAARMFDLAELEKDIGEYKAPFLAQIIKANEALRIINAKHKEELEAMQLIAAEARDDVEAATVHAWEEEGFPEGKKRLGLDDGAHVQVSERVSRTVEDASQAVRYIVAESIEDTAIRTLTLDKDVVDAIMTLKGKFPGVLVRKNLSVSISLPKEEKRAT